MLVRCYHAMLTLGKSLPSHQRSSRLLWKRYYFRLTTILISCWSLEAEGKVLKKSAHCHRKTCPKKQFVQFLFFIYHNWSSLIKLLQPFISDTKEVQLHPSKIRGYPLSPLKCCPSILYCLLLKILLQQTLLFILQHNVFIAMFIGRTDERAEQGESARGALIRL